jgi:hypothetical protein
VVYLWTGLLQFGCWSFILKNNVGPQKDRFKPVATGYGSRALCHIVTVVITFNSTFGSSKTVKN